MGWLNLKIIPAAIDPTALSDLLLELGGLAVSVINTDPDGRAEDTWFDQPGQSMIIDPETAAVTVLLPGDTDVQPILETVRIHFNLKDIPVYQISEVPDQDWVRSTQKLSRPWKIGERLWIVPTWDRVPDPAAVNIRLDPGVAFGSGTHPTTSLCLEWLETNIRGGERVLDYGCGSGILAIAALKLGAAEALGVDIDQNAVNSTIANARLNQVVCPACLPDVMPAMQYDIVLANILANPLKELAPRLVRFTIPGGMIILSGILETQTAAVCRVYRRYFDLAAPVQRDDWVLLSGRKKTDRGEL
ncbi:MAG: 50S ribosomal protein L11 methyltransferase [Candidatus Neomarinimicrobiota bacterium]